MTRSNKYIKDADLFFKYRRARKIAKRIKNRDEMSAAPLPEYFKWDGEKLKIRELQNPAWILLSKNKYPIQKTKRTLKAPIKALY